MSTPTIALFYDDDYAQEMDARLVAAGPDGIVLDRTVFYPRGGNQDSDQGTLRAADAPPLQVAEVLKDESGVIRHRTEPAAPETWAAGTAVHGRLDWDRRITLMRLHTAQHLVSRWFLDHGDNATGRVDITAAGCTIELARPVTVAEALDCQEGLNALIAAGRAVRRIDTDGYLEIEVAGYDRQPCGGTHVHDVAEIGRIAFTRVKGNRLEMQAGPAAQAVERTLAEAGLGLQGALETDLAGFAARVERLLADTRAQRAELTALREEVASARVERALAAARPVAAPGGALVQVVAIDLEMIESRLLPRLLKPVQAGDRIFFCLCAGRNLAVLSGSPVLPAGALVAALKDHYGLSGGGSPAYAQCGPLPADVPLADAVDVALRAAAG